jgi:hypothetical protein
MDFVLAVGNGSGAKLALSEVPAFLMHQKQDIRPQVGYLIFNRIACHTRSFLTKEKIEHPHPEYQFRY